MHAAELSAQGGRRGALSHARRDADYGVIGVNPAQFARNVFDVTGQLLFPIWAGRPRPRRHRSRPTRSLQQRRAEYEDLRARVEADVRNAYLDLNAAAEQVRVAQSRRELAQDELTQSRDRFASGVADTVEVVQAQEVVSSAEQDYIASLNAHNLAKASVARAIGQAEKIMRTLLEESIIMAVDQLQQSSAPRPATSPPGIQRRRVHRQHRRGTPQDA